MDRVGLCLLLLLFSGAAWAGEICRRWTKGVETPIEVFYCPVQHGGAGANFCCGTCYAPYCCSSGEARLDQDECPGGGRWQAGDLQLLTNISEDLLTATPLSNLIAGMLVTGLMAIVVLDVFLCCNVVMYLRFRYEARQQRRAMDNPDTSARPSGSDSSPPRRFLDRPRVWLGNLSVRPASDHPTASYGTFVDEVEPSSAEDTPAPQDLSLPSTDAPVCSQGISASSSEDEVVILSPPAAASEGILCQENNQ